MGEISPWGTTGNLGSLEKNAVTPAIKVLDLRDSPWVDGPGRTVLESAPALNELRYQVTIGGFCSSRVEDNVYLSDARRRGLEIEPIFETGSFDLRILRQIMMVLDRHDIDILHTHDFRSNFFGLYCAKRRRIPIVSTCHGWIANDAKGAVKKHLDFKLLSRFERVAAVSKSMKSMLMARGVAEQRIEVIPNALVVDNYQPVSEDGRFRRDLGINDETRLLLNVGRLSVEKGQVLLLNALAKIYVDHPDICLVFVGIGPEEAVLREEVSRLGLAGCVYFAGYRSDMTTVYNSADVVIQSSLTEGMPNVILESLLMMTPVVATDVGGTAEIVENGRFGRLVSPSSEQELVDGIDEFLRNEREFREMASDGRENIIRNFNQDTRVCRIANLYESVVSQGRR